MTNAKVVGLQDHPNLFATLFDPRLWQVCPIVQNVTCPRTTRFIGHLPEHAAPHCLDCAMDPRERCPHTEKPSEVHQPQESHASNSPSKTSLPPSTQRDTSSLPSLQFCTPRLYRSLELVQFLECGFGSMSPFCVVTALQTSEIHGNSVGTRQQLMASVEGRQVGVTFNMASISGCLS